jgi:hypothetical protein
MGTHLENGLWNQSAFVIPYDGGLLLILGVAFASKPSAQHRYLLVLLFGVVLAAAFGQIFIYSFP